MLLTEDQLQQLTGYVQPAAQIRWLHRSGWHFTVNAIGKPVVAIAEFERRMVGSISKRAQLQEPDWTAIN